MDIITNKRLLFLDCSALGFDAIRRSKELGVYTIAANFHRKDSQPGKQIADESIDIDISNIDAMLLLIRRKKVDGIFVGWTDSHLPYYQELCEKAGFPCCGTKSQFQLLSNDKNKFKELCRNYGIPVVSQFNLDIRFDPEDMSKLKYPILIKPADESGGRNLAVCSDEKALICNYSELYNRSKNKQIVVEEYIDNADEVFFQYTIQNGKPSLSSAFTKHKIYQYNSYVGLPILHVFPSSHISGFLNNVNQSIVNMLKDIKIYNGIIVFQGFVKDEKIILFESGFRMGGSQFYVFTEHLTGINSCEMMIRFALTGVMGGYDASKLDNPYFSKPCCNYYVPLRKGVITVMDGVDKVREMPEVLQLAQILDVGKNICAGASLDIVCLRIHVMADTKQLLAAALEEISQTLHIFDENNNDMQLEPLTYDKALKLINNS